MVDEQISPVIADQIRAQRAEVTIEGIDRWRAGEFAGVDDAPMLTAANGFGGLIRALIRLWDEQHHFGWSASRGEPGEFVESRSR